VKKPTRKSCLLVPNDITISDLLINLLDILVQFDSYTQNKNFTTDWLIDEICRKKSLFTETMDLTISFSFSRLSQI
jgi:hypothetical protein